MATTITTTTTITTAADDVAGDAPDPRRPGGARGVEPPNLAPGRTIAAWLESGDVVHLDQIDEDAEPDRPEFPWALVDSWVPL